MENKSIACWFSCGVPSAVAAKKALELYGCGNEVRVLNNPIAEEHPDNKRFLLEVQEWLGVEVETISNPDWPNASAVYVLATTEGSVLMMRILLKKETGKRKVGAS